MAVRCISQSLEVDDIAGRVADRFAEHRLGLVVDQHFQCSNVVMWREAHLNALTGKGMGKQVVCAAIQLGH